mgnify:CR=1 FL=1
MIRTIKSIYKKTGNIERTDNAGFVTTKGVRQRGERGKIVVWKLQQLLISMMMYADDLVILVGTEKELQKKLEIWDKEFKDYGMNINVEKTEVMVIGKSEQKINIKLDNKIVNRKESFNTKDRQFAHKGE